MLQVLQVLMSNVFFPAKEERMKIRKKRLLVIIFMVGIVSGVASGAIAEALNVNDNESSIACEQENLPDSYDNCGRLPDDLLLADTECAGKSYSITCLGQYQCCIDGAGNPFCCPWYNTCGTDGKCY